MAEPSQRRAASCRWFIDRGRRGKTRERGNDLLVGDLSEVLVKPSDRPQFLVSFEADDVISFLPHLNKRLGWSNRDGEHQLLRIAQTGRAQCRACGRPRSNTIIDDNGNTAVDVDPGTVTQIALTPALNLGKLSRTDRFELGLRDPHKLNDIFVAYDNRLAAVDHRTDRQFGSHGSADLAHKDQIQRCVQGGRNFRGDRDAAARQRQNDGFLKLVSGERFGKSPPSLRSIWEWHHSLLCSLCEVGSWARRRYRLSQFLAWSTNGFQGPALSAEVAGTGNDLQRLWSSISTARAAQRTRRLDAAPKRTSHQTETCRVEGFSLAVWPTPCLCLNRQSPRELRLRQVLSRPDR